MVIEDQLNKHVVVQKYGGSSLKNVERIQAVGASIKTLVEDGKGVLVVVSAMGDRTDELVEMANQLTANNPSDREYDALVSTGENVSASLLSMHLQYLGIEAISLNGSQAGIETEGLHRRAKIRTIRTERIVQELQENKVVVVTGFQGISQASDVTTIGRGGSDTSAVVLAAALGVSCCEIYTDVTGIFSTDPRIEPQAKQINRISYDEMLELASLGAKVLHPRAVEVAKQKGVKILVASSYEPKISGTIVEEISHMEIQKPVTGVALKKDEARLSIMGVKDVPGVAAVVFNALDQASVIVDMIIQSSEENGLNDISFTVSKEDVIRAESVLEDVAKKLFAKGIRVQSNIAKVSIVGIGMINKHGVAAKMFQALSENNINIHLISTSEIKISCAIDETQAESAVRILHRIFELA